VLQWQWQRSFESKLPRRASISGPTQTAHFLDEDGSSEEERSLRRGRRLSDYGWNESLEGKDELYSSENNFGDHYSISSNEYYVGAVKIGLQSHQGYRRGSRMQSAS
jgi:hypothetical protein